VTSEADRDDCFAWLKQQIDRTFVASDGPLTVLDVLAFLFINPSPKFFFFVFFCRRTHGLYCLHKSSATRIFKTSARLPLSSLSPCSSTSTNVSDASNWSAATPVMLLTTQTIRLCYSTPQTATLKLSLTRISRASRISGTLHSRLSYVAQSYIFFIYLLLNISLVFLEHRSCCPQLPFPLFARTPAVSGHEEKSTLILKLHFFF